MSDRFRKVTGCLLLCSVLLLLAAGLLPLRKTLSVPMAARGLKEVTVSPLPHLDESDVFNSGSAEELISLPGIGGATASLVIAEREKNGLFLYPEDILSVKGIGNKKLEQLRPFLKTVSGESEE